MKLIRELRLEIKRLKSIIAAAKLQDPDLLSSGTALEENIHKKEEMVSGECVCEGLWMVFFGLY